jgi:acyl-coenzyme A thioesterase PaaI-like protein
MGNSLDIQDDFNATHLTANRNQTHSKCVVCSPQNIMGLKLEFTVNPDGSVNSSILPGSPIQGYDGFVHGGVIASMLDGAMTNCLFAHNVVALTAELVIRYHKPVLIGERIEIRAWLENDLHLLFCTRAELSQKGQIKASAKARFLNKP